MSSRIRGAADFLLTNPKANRIFQAIEESHGRASGWNIAKTAGMPAEEAERLMKSLKECGLVDATDAGLDGFYYVTKLGFNLRSGLRIAV